MLIVVVVVFRILKANPKNQEKIDRNEQLNTEQTIILIKNAISNLSSSEDLVTNSISDEEMIVFALGYLQVTGEGSIKRTNDGMASIMNLEEIEQTVKFIFDRQIDYNKVSFKIETNKILIPTVISSTDLQIFKYRKKDYDETNNEYTVYIDCLEPRSASDISKLIKPTILDYSESDVFRTIIFKYKEVDGRKVLLSYKKINNL